MNYRIVGAAIVLAAIPLAVLAQATLPRSPEATSQAREKVRTACATDIQKFCANVERGKGGGMRSCLETHERDLSNGCKAARAERAAARAKEKG